jgi:RNA recognition motif-containing protein
MQPQAMTENHQPPLMNVGPPGNVGFNHFRTPPQPPIVPGLVTNSYQQHPQQMANSEWGDDERLPLQQQPYIPNNDFQGETYGGGSDDEDDRQAEFDNNYHRRFNDNNPTMRRGRPGQDFHDQQGFGTNRNPRFHKPQQSMAGGGQQNRGGHRQFDSFGGGGGPRFNHHQQHPRYGGGLDGNGRGGGRPSRFSSIQDGSGGKPSRFNAMQQQRGKDDDGGDDGSDFNDPKRGAAPARFNDRYRYDVRNSQTPRAEGLCVEVNNMTNHFSYGDVRKVFEGIHIDGSAIKIQKHRQGVAFVRFDNNHNKNLALRMNGNAYKGNNVVVKHLDDEAYERENTDDRPYPTTVAATVAPATTTAAVATASPNVVDLVDLVDDEEDNDGGKPSGAKRKKNDVRSDEDCNNLVVCDKNPSASEGGGNGGEGEVQQSQQQQPQQQQQQQQQEVPTKYLKLKQLPITVTEEDVLNEMEGGGEVRRVTFYPDGEFMGAALEFRSVDEAEATLKRFDCVLLGSTPVPVLRCTYKDYVQIKRKSGGGTRRFSGENTTGGGGRHFNHQQHHNPMSAQPPVQSNVVPTCSRSNCVYVHGLPTSVTNTDITQFFADTSVLPDKIHIMLSKFGRPTGESYCEFSSVQQAHTALIKDQCYMGPNLVHVSPINRSDMIQAITKPMQQHNNHHQDMSWGPGGGGGNRGGGPRQHNMMSGPRQQHQGPQSSYGGSGGHNGGYGGGRPQPYMNNARGGGYTPRIRGPGPNTGPDGFGQPGCVVALDNVPYCADVQEIVDFFSGFELNSQNVIRRFNDFGKPTGEARVNLRNPQEAMRAVRVLQNKPIFNRPVRLTLL